MSVQIRNAAQLKKVILSRVNKALAETRLQMSAVIQKYVDIYYDEYDPKKYERTYKLMLDSILIADVVQQGNRVSVQVGVDDDYLRYRYEGGATGEDIFSWASGLEGDEHIHGYTVGGRVHIWEDAMDEIGGREGILNLLKDNLRKQGVPIK